MCTSKTKLSWFLNLLTYCYLLFVFSDGVTLSLDGQICQCINFLCDVDFL